MDDNDLNKLVKQLEELRIERERIGYEERRIIEQIKDASSSTKANSQPDSTEEAQFAIGQRVYITNRVGHVPFTRRTSPKDRAAVVNRVTKTRVYITTYNGYDTWRHSSNLKRLTRAKHEDIVSS